MTSPYGTGTVSPFALSGDTIIDSLVNIGTKWGSGGLGVGAVVTYSFPQKGAAWISDYLNGEPFDGFQGFSVAQQNAARQALALWSDVANITFQEIPDTAGDVGDIRFGFSRVVTNSSAAAWAYSPYDDPVVEFPEAGDVWLDGKYAPNLQMTPGKFGFATLLHEIGHAIGLDHPFDDGYGEPTIPGSMNTNQYTLMAYGEHLTASVEAMTPMLLDILAIQYIYGANMTTRAGDDVYKFSTSEQLRAIWDAGGIDTIDASNQTLAATIDLEEGAFSSIGRRNAGGAAKDNIAIAYGAVIENATGGGGADKIFGNDIANVLAGNAGNDILDGRAGADTMRGGRGNDVYVFDNVGDVLDEQGNKDLGDEIRIAASVNLVNFAGGVIERATALGNAAIDLTGNKAANTLTGNAAINILDGAAGADTLKGAAGNDIYYIDALSDRIDEGTNKDSADEVRSTVAVNLTTLGKGQVENATLLGAAAVNVIGNGFNNFITGNDAANSLSGGNGNDALIGMNGKDSLTGGNGNDTLDGGIGNDVLNGGLGNDTYFIDSAGDKIIDSGTKDLNDLVISSVSVDLGILGLGLLEHATLVGADPLNAIGNGRNNILAGNAGANLLFGDLGDDKLDGGLGADTLRGGKGNDTYSIDADDIVDEQSNADAGDLVLTALSIDLAVYAAGAIEHVVFGGANAVNGSGNGADNSLTGNDSANTLDGGGGNDTLIGNGGDDVLTGGTGDDVMNGGAGTNVLKGGSGNDVYYRSTFGEVYTIDEEGNLDTGDEIRLLGSVDLSVFANGAIEHATLLEELFTAGSSLVGNAGFNILTGSSYMNFLDGAGGDDLLIGGGGGDIYTVDSDGDVIQETGRDDADEVRSSAISLDLTKIGNGEIENARLLGSLNLNIVGNANYSYLMGNSGDNKIDGSKGMGSINGLEGNDYLITGRAYGYVDGGNGDDVLEVANPFKIQLIDGGSGNDTLFLSSGGLKIDFRYDLGGLSEIEAIDVRNGDRDDLEFDEEAALKMSFTTDELKIRGDAGDYVRLSAEFVDQGDTVVDGVTYSILASKNATILVESGMEIRNEAVGKLSLADLSSPGVTLINGANQYAGSAGDFNNDGIDDLVFGATTSGSAWIASGSASGFPASIATNPLSVSGVTIAGDDSPDGYDVAGDAD
ncbi:MAG TPA: M10 family metallopeptidase, partial [Dongiaceae bacterium]|nr:M10 family metallopeptidase [Dongiaceae bacterium]